MGWLNDFLIPVHVSPLYLDWHIKSLGGSIFSLGDYIYLKIVMYVYVTHRSPIIRRYTKTRR
jgi:hypothetical protein